MIAGVIGLVRLVVLSPPCLDLNFERGEENQPEIQAIRANTCAAVPRAALTEGKPRNAIVRCWVDLEDVTERAGMDRDWSETSSEFTARVLGVWGIEKDSVDRLAALYREARFSSHPVTEQMRDEAVAAIDEIHHQLPPRAGAEVPRNQS